MTDVFPNQFFIASLVFLIFKQNDLNVCEEVKLMHKNSWKKLRSLFFSVTILSVLRQKISF